MLAVELHVGLADDSAVEQLFHLRGSGGEEIQHPLAILLQLGLLHLGTDHHRPGREAALPPGVLGMIVGGRQIEPRAPGR